MFDRRKGETRRDETSRCKNPASMASHAALAEIGVAYELVKIDRETAQTDPSRA